MSSIIVSPSEKTENVIYLAFSVVTVTFLLYLAEWWVKGTIIPGFVPNPFVVAAGGAALAAILVYTTPDDLCIRKLLLRKTRKELCSMIPFILYGDYLLQSWVVETRKMTPAHQQALNHVESTLDGNDLNNPIWKIRGAVWFLLSIPMTIAVLLSVSPLSLAAALCVGAFSVSVAAIAIITSSFNEYNGIVKKLLLVAEFLWFDQTLTSIQMTEVTPETGVSKVNLKIDGLTEALYRGIVAAHGQGKKVSIEEVPDVIRPNQEYSSVSRKYQKAERKVTLHGAIASADSKSRERKRIYRALLAEECKYLRDLVRRRSWSVFTERHKQLKSSVIEKSKRDVEANLLDFLKSEWRKSIAQHQVTVAFSNLRLIAAQMKECDLLPERDLVQIWGVLRPQNVDMVNRNWVYPYFRKWLEGDKRFEDLILGIAKDWLSSAPIRPDEPYDYLEEAIGFIEDTWKESTGYSDKVFSELSDAESEKIEKGLFRLQDYVEWPKDMKKKQGSDKT